MNRLLLKFPLYNVLLAYTVLFEIINSFKLVRLLMVAGMLPLKHPPKFSRCSSVRLPISGAMLWLAAGGAFKSNSRRITRPFMITTPGQPHMDFVKSHCVASCPPNALYTATRARESCLFTGRFFGETTITRAREELKI